MIRKEVVTALPNETFQESEIFPLLYSIVNSKIDTIYNLDNFLQLIVDAGAKIVSARNSSLVIFNENIDSFLSDSKNQKKEEEFSPFRNVLRSESHITIPLKLREVKDPFGYLRVEGKLDQEDQQKFDSKDLFLLLLLSRQATLKIENDFLYKSVHRNLTNTLGTMVNMLESRNRYIHSHSQRVTQLALNIAEKLSLDQKERDALSLAGLLHDIGKIGVPDSILDKKDTLSMDEFDVIKTHPVVGEDMIRPLEFLTLEKSIIRHHHERLDGSGYPDGLQSEEIPMCTKVIAVADCFDAMTSNRPYRKAKSSLDSMKELECLADEKYDKDVVYVLKKSLLSH